VAGLRYVRVTIGDLLAAASPEDRKRYHQDPERFLAMMARPVLERASELLDQAVALDPTRPEELARARALKDQAVRLLASLAVVEGASPEEELAVWLQAEEQARNYLLGPAEET
jgi:hypothetical protein